MALILVLGCTAPKQSIGFEVPFHTNACAGANLTYSESKVTSEGLSIISNIITDIPCYKLAKAEISRVDNDLIVYFTLIKESGTCEPCLGIQSLIYQVSGEGLNKSGINVTVIALAGTKEISHSFIS